MSVAACLAPRRVRARRGPAGGQLAQAPPRPRAGLHARGLRHLPPTARPSASSARSPRWTAASPTWTRAATTTRSSSATTGSSRSSTPTSPPDFFGRSALAGQRGRGLRAAVLRRAGRLARRAQEGRPGGVADRLRRRRRQARPGRRRPPARHQRPRPARHAVPARRPRPRHGRRQEPQARPRPDERRAEHLVRRRARTGGRATTTRTSRCTTRPARGRRFLRSPDGRRLARGRVAQRRAPRPRAVGRRAGDGRAVDRGAGRRERAHDRADLPHRRAVHRRAARRALPRPRRHAAPAAAPQSAARKRKATARAKRATACRKARRAARRARTRSAAAPRTARRAPLPRLAAAVSPRPPARPPARRRPARPARGTASTTRSRAREWWKNSIESGSPPCSPQIPSFRSRFADAPEPRAHPHELADAGRVDRLERRAVEDLQVDVAGEDPALDVVAREAERRSASGRSCRTRRSRRASAIASARKHARGSSIIVPIEVVRRRGSRPCSSADARR